jgi:iron complex outermembrane receptor protein
VLWSPTENAQYFININEGYEPPGISDLTSGGAFPFTELLAQESVTVEIGSRGFYKSLAWDVAAYRSEVENELIDVAAPGFFGNSTVTNTENAEGDTIHQGIELGIDLDLIRSTVNNSGNLRFRNILTYNDFQFDGDATYRNNTLAGVPELIYVAELRYDHGEKWYAGLNMRHVANGAYADYENTFQAPGYQIWGLTAGWTINGSTKVFGSVENIGDESFISNVSTVANLSTEGNQRVFTPGEGRSAYVGVTFSF